ncbi:hypothetical protein Shyhy01_03500 [Streptomyces hygroscopicus subsp. hygroscopicus]|nr:hypothetical protein Shyhy01_03500 [Streptomyces hygroscopicus subsp. hygroscopicus]
MSAGEARPVRVWFGVPLATRRASVPGLAYDVVTVAGCGAASSVLAHCGGISWSQEAPAVCRHADARSLTAVVQSGVPWFSTCGRRREGNSRPPPKPSGPTRPAGNA